LPINVPSLAIIAQKTAAGTATADIPIETFSEQEAITNCGQGSHGHLCAKAALKANPNVRLTLVPVDDGAGTAATGTIVVANVPTTSGYYEIWVGDVRAQVTVTSGDAVNDIAAAIDAAINLVEHNTPITSGVATATVTLTARNDGLLGNNIPISYKNHGIETTTLTVTQMGDVVAGATDPDITTALTNMLPEKYDRILVANNDATNLALLKTHLNTQVSPTENKPGIGIFGYTGVQATFQTLAGTTLNSGWITGAYLKYSKTSERGHSLDFEVGAAYAAILCKKSDPAIPYNNEALVGIAPPDKAQRLTRTQKQAIIDDGGTPLHVLSGEIVSIVRAVTTRTTNSASIEDKALIDVTTVTTLFYLRRAIEEDQGRVFKQAKKTARTKLLVKSRILAILDLLVKAEITQPLKSPDEVIVEDDLSNVYQLVTQIPAYVVVGLHNLANKIVLFLT
jgi:phage tail sheath gpL-like